MDEFWARILSSVSLKKPLIRPFLLGHLSNITHMVVRGQTKGIIQTYGRSTIFTHLTPLFLSFSFGFSFSDGANTNGSRVLQYQIDEQLIHSIHHEELGPWIVNEIENMNYTIISQNLSKIVRLT